MALKSIDDPVIGKVIISKRKGTKHIRISINSKGETRLSLPYFVTTSMGLGFARSKIDWINKQKQKMPESTIRDGMLIGKTQHLVIDHDNQNPKTYSRSKDGLLHIFNFLPQEEASNKIANQAIIRSLKTQSEQLLLPRLVDMANYYGYKFKSVKIKVLRSRWGSCSNNKDISISVFLIQLPWDLIDYVLLHELVHTKQMNHSKQFWTELEADMPDYKQRKIALKKYRPHIIS